MKVLFATLLLTSPALGAGYTGASMLADTSDFAAGFAWGIVSYRTGIAGAPDEIARQMEIHDCLVRGDVGSGVFLQSVKARLLADPSLLPAPAAAGVLQTLNAMCPPKAQ